VTNKVSIDLRPPIVEKRCRFGDLGIDLIIGRKRKQAIVTICDRASGMVKLRKIPSKHADGVEKALIGELQDWLPYVKTITSDNGTEFAHHAIVAKSLDVTYFFAHPYHPW